ncbi:MAG: hypothetical protein KatS3mg076_1801 [Candidatus Binatia bacterium]|nr:MAG: hypothetical protein KatS3mg076_1801 [Candidatus Binatia bacterium]
MRFRVQDIGAEVKELVYEEPTEELDELLGTGPIRDYTCRLPARVEVRYYRAGREVFFEGSLDAPLVGRCARCLEEFSVPLRRSFHFVLLPADTVPTVQRDDVELAHYHGDEIDLSPLLREEVLLALPIRPLCREDCLGLCPHCGANRNEGRCACVEEKRDVRWAALWGLKVGR